MDDIQIRECLTIDELDKCVLLQRDVFGLPDLEISPRRHLVVSRQAGGWTLGAFTADGRLAGFVHHLIAVRGADDHPVHAVGRQVQPGRRPQQRGGLLDGEAKVPLAELAELAAGAQPGERQRRVGAAGQHQPQLRRRPFQQQREVAVDRRGVDQVIVVQDQHDLLVPTGQLVDHSG